CFASMMRRIFESGILRMFPYTSVLIRTNKAFKKSRQCCDVTTNSSIRVKGAGQERETFLPGTPSVLSKNFRVITFFASAKSVQLRLLYDFKQGELCSKISNRMGCH
ncbi:MAG: hypothetical protein J6C40_01905, partial [Lentisphaeria bacterium]|nr:hypothetical protein [Lentisphaeria bacterium]